MNILRRFHGLFISFALLPVANFAQASDYSLRLVSPTELSGDALTLEDGFEAETMVEDASEFPLDSFGSGKALGSAATLQSQITSVQDYFRTRIQNNHDPRLSISHH